MVFKLSKKLRRSKPQADLEKQSQPTPAAPVNERVTAGPSTSALRRNCGWYERLFVSTSNTGEPLYATFIARIEKSFDEVHAATSVRVEELIDKVAMLSARVGDIKTRNPYFEVSQRRTAADVIHLQTALDGSRDEIREDVHTRAVRYAQDTFNIEQGRLWNVGLWKAAPAQEQQNVTYLSLTILHLAADGLGGRFLFEALISPTMPEHITFLPGLPPTCEQTIGYKLQGKVIRELVWTAFSFLMPKPIRYRMTSVPHWPLKIERHPSTQETARKIITLDGSVVPKLKAAAKANGLATINPVISVAALAALFAVTAPEDEPDSNKRLPFHLALETPIALREPEKLKHSSCAGNFSGAHLHKAQLRRNTSIWAEAREYADSLKNCDSNSSLQFLAMAKLVPDPKSYKGTDQAPTPWEAFILNEMKKPQPFRSSLDLVNLGAMRGPKNGRVSEISISGTIDQTYSAFMLTCASFISSDPDIPSHMSMTSSWRQGCIPDDVVAGFMSNLRKVFTLIDSGRVGADATFGDVAEMLKEDGLREWAAPDFEACRAAAAAAARRAAEAEVIPTVVATSSLTAPTETIEDVLLGRSSPASLGEETASVSPSVTEVGGGGGGGSSPAVAQKGGDEGSHEAVPLMMSESKADDAILDAVTGGPVAVAVAAVARAVVEKAELTVGDGNQVLVPVLASVL